MSTKLHDEPAASRPSGGRIIAGRFELKRMIARGGMGVVYLAEQIDLGRRVALKLLKAQNDPDNSSAFQERFTLEARTLAQLSHPNIVTLYDYGQTDDGRYFLALEYIDGPRFTDIIQKGAIEPERCIYLLLQVCRALRYSHRKNVIHRDLKPSNLLIQLDDEGREQVKVVDFGLVKVLEDDQSLTQAGLILGSPHCMAPEQVRGDRDIDHRADIYALGILLFRAITGTWPFHGDSSTATMIAHINEPIPPFSEVAPDLMLPPGLEEIIQRCLAKQPIDRYPDAGALMQALQNCIGLNPAEYVSTSLSIASLHANRADRERSVLTEEVDNQTLSTHLKQNRSSSLVLLLLLLFVASGAGTLGWFLNNRPEATVISLEPNVTPPPPDAVVPDPDSTPDTVPDAASGSGGDPAVVPEPEIEPPPAGESGSGGTGSGNATSGGTGAAEAIATPPPSRNTGSSGSGSRNNGGSRNSGSGGSQTTTPDPEPETNSGSSGSETPAPSGETDGGGDELPDYMGLPPDLMEGG